MRLEELTGTNNVPLGSTRRFGRGDTNPTSPPRQEQKLGAPKHAADVLASSQLENGHGRSFARVDVDQIKKRKRGNRWSDTAESNQVADLVGLPTAIFANMSLEQLEAYATHVRIMEITQKLKIGDVVPSERIRYVHSDLCLTALGVVALRANVE